MADEQMNLRVLVVEDEQLFARLLEHQVGGIFKTAIVDKAGTVDEAVSKVTSGTFDVCLLDLFLIDRSGFEVLDHINAESPATAVVVMTAHSRMDLVADAVSRGARDYLIKGQYDAFELEKAITFAVYAKRREQAILALAIRDPLTGLANRAAFREILENAILRAGRTGHALALLYIDIDGFKPVNDTHGHAAGDALLKAFADRLAHAVRRSDTCGRLGGDEFALILEHPTDRNAAVNVANTVREALISPYALEAGAIRIGASIGVAFLPDDGRSPEDLQAAADARMYAVKRRGGGVAWEL